MASDRKSSSLAESLHWNAFHNCMRNLLATGCSIYNSASSFLVVLGQGQIDTLL